MSHEINQDAAAVRKAADRAFEYFSLTLGTALDDAAKLRALVKAQVTAMRSTLESMPIEGSISPSEADTLFGAMDNACDALQALVSTQEDAMEATARECRKMGEVVP